MAIVSCQPIWPARARIDKRGIRWYWRKWRVVVDNLTTGPLEAGSHASLPSIGDYYQNENGEYDYSATLIGLDPEQDSDDPEVYVVTGEYSSEFDEIKAADSGLGTLTGGGQQQGDADDQDPINWAPEISGDFAAFSRAVEVDLDGKPMAATTGEKFDPPKEMEDAVPVVTVVVNIPSTTISGQPAAFNILTWLRWHNCVNDDTWTFLGTNFGKGTVKLVKAPFQEMHNKAGTLYYRLSFELQLKDEGWMNHPRNEGTYQVVSSERRAILDPKSHMPVTSPVPLDINGVPLTPQTAVGSTTTSDTSLVGDESMDVVSDAGVVIGGALVVNSGEATQEIVHVTEDWGTGTNVIQLAEPLRYAHDPGETVSWNNYCYLTRRLVKWLDFDTLPI